MFISYNKGNGKDDKLDWAYLSDEVYRLIKMVLFAKTSGKKARKPARGWMDDNTEWSGDSVWMAKTEAEQRMDFRAKR